MNKTIHLEPQKYKNNFQTVLLFVPSFIFVLALAFYLRVFVLNNKNQERPNTKAQIHSMVSKPQKKVIRVNDHKIEVEVLDTAATRKKGLSGKDSLPMDKGVLFVFDQSDVYERFWMKDMNFAIDIIWIDDGRVVQIDADVAPPEPGTPNKDLILYPANQPVDYVLEVNAGFSEENNIKVGTVVDL